MDEFSSISTRVRQYNTFVVCEKPEMVSLIYVCREAYVNPYIADVIIFLLINYDGKDISCSPITKKA